MYGLADPLGADMNARAWSLFAAVSVVWGMPYLFIKVAVDDGGVPPGFLAWVRVVLGAAVLLGWSWQAGLLDGLRPRWPWLAAFGLLEIVIPFPLIAVGEQHVDSSLAAIIIATVPLFVALLALRFDAGERATGRRLVGLVVGLAGVVALMGIDVAGEADELFGAAMLLVAALGYAAGPMVLKRHLSDVDSRASMGASLAFAALALTPVAAADPPDGMPPGSAIAALVVLGLLCTAAGLVLYGMLITEVGPGRGVVITYVNPIVALALGVVFLDERPGTGALLGLALILAGSWLSTTAPPPEASPDDAVPVVPPPEPVPVVPVPGTGTGAQAG
jgi:drug/metabolite transporter (DMT)-like permease